MFICQTIPCHLKHSLGYVKSFIFPLFYIYYIKIIPLLWQTYFLFVCLSVSVFAHLNVGVIRQNKIESFALMGVIL